MAVRERFETLEWLLAKIDSVDLQANYRCHPSLRRLTINVLERCLIDAECFGLYLSSLKRLLGDTFRYERVLDIKEVRRVYTGGLDTLDNRNLVHLALSPIELRALYHRIGGQMRFNECRYWTHLMETRKNRPPSSSCWTRLAFAVFESSHQRSLL